MTDILTPTLPGSIPGLLRRGSPVFYRDEESSWTVLCIDGDEVCAAPVGEVPLGLWGMCDDFTLDLTDATGRAHAAWWLAGALYPECPPTDGAAVAWQLFPGQQPSSGWWLRYCARGDSSGSTTVSPTFSGRWNPRMWSQHIPALAPLDPDDPRLLPDGSRWVDAEALRLVCLHVAEVANA